jgi:hypothetical protein
MTRTKQKARRKSNHHAKQLESLAPFATLPKKNSNLYAKQMAISRSMLAENQELASLEIKESMECPLVFLPDCKHKKSCTCAENWKYAWKLYGLEQKTDHQRRQKWFGMICRQFCKALPLFFIDNMPDHSFYE